MTWGEFINSKYTNGVIFTIRDNVVYYDGAYVNDVNEALNAVLSTDVIIEDKVYYYVNSGSAN